MNIRDRRQLHETARQRLEQAQYKNRIILIYTSITVGLAALVTVITYILGQQISQTGGLSNMGLRSILSTANFLLPILQNLVLFCLELGFLNAMIRMSRGLYTSPQSLRAGMPRFWAAIRCTLLLSFRYILIGFCSFYLAVTIFTMTPLSREAISILEPLMAQMTVMDTQLVLEADVVARLLDSMTSAFVIWGLLLVVTLVPVYYRYRLANYILMDKPAYGALMALEESKVLMRKNGFAMFRLDLSLWWYYLLAALSTAVCYGDVILRSLGVSLPWSDTVSYFVFYGLFLAIQFALSYFFGNRVGITYALAYEALKPEEKPTGGVVLGNIFQT